MRCWKKDGIPKLIHSLGAKAHAMVETCDTDRRWPHFKGPLYGEIATGKRPTERPQLRFKDIYKRGFQALGINTGSWEVAAIDRDAWRHIVKLALSQYEETKLVRALENRLHKKTVCLANRPTTAFICSKCCRDCHFWVGLHNHNRHCTMSANL